MGKSSALTLAIPISASPDSTLVREAWLFVWLIGAATASLAGVLMMERVELVRVAEKEKGNAAAVATVAGLGVAEGKNEFVAGVGSAAGDPNVVVVRRRGWAAA